MPSASHGDLKDMQSLIDHLSAHTRAPNTLGVPAVSFSSLLPVVKDKIPEDWPLEWARQESSDFDALIQFLNREMRLRESRVWPLIWLELRDKKKHELLLSTKGRR